MARVSSVWSGLTTILIYRELPEQLRSRQLSDRTQSPWHSVASENLAGVEQLIELLLGARRLQLALAPGSTGSPGQAALCQPLVAVSKDMVASMIHLGASNLLWQVDMCKSGRVRSGKANEQSLPTGS